MKGQFYRANYYKRVMKKNHEIEYFTEPERKRYAKRIIIINLILVGFLLALIYII
jgi:hypothetical protein